MRNDPQPNPYYTIHPAYQAQHQQQMQQLQQQGFVKKKGCNCGKKKNTSDQQNQG
ncbi:cytochrome C oxidase subunit III [Bacillus sp. NPDC094106]|uniref:cytochrome C oxidase subunit III n=1 Tax=Bacillus sp. NPDC094106 TaxID=3363949 RepID=UPI00382F0779